MDSGIRRDVRAQARRHALTAGVASVAAVRQRIIPPMTRRRAPEGIPILIALDPKASESLSRQIYRALRDGILAGRLVGGLRLPSTRALATDLGVSRNTVVTAFDQLLAEGYVESRVGRGTRVSQHDARPSTSRPVETARAVGHGAAVERTVGSRLAARRACAPRNRRSRKGRSRSRLACPRSTCFRGRRGVGSSRRRGRELGAHTAGYADSLGYRPLRDAVARYVAVARGVTCTTDQVVIVGGSQQGLDLVARVATDPGDSAWIEDPGYHGALGAFAAAGLRVTGVPVDADGMSVAAGRVGAPAARLMYVTPSHQFPLGVTMSLSRRLELLAAAAEMQAWIVEDDYDSEFRYVSRPAHGAAGTRHRWPSRLRRHVQQGDVPGAPHRVRDSTTVAAAGDRGSPPVRRDAAAGPRADGPRRLHR